jgi:hypothetical protein
MTRNCATSIFRESSAELCRSLFTLISGKLNQVNSFHDIFPRFPNPLKVTSQRVDDEEIRGFALFKRAAKGQSRDETVRQKN